MKRTETVIREQTATWEKGVAIVLGGSPINQSVCDLAGADRWCNDALQGVRIVREVLGAS
jgi:methanogenic corrinoid protein MtbC1